MDDIILEIEADPDWSEGDTAQLLRLLFGPRADDSADQPSQ